MLNRHIKEKRSGIWKIATLVNRVIVNLSQNYLDSFLSILSYTRSLNNLKVDYELKWEGKGAES